jgi:hypothetical protein
MNVTAAVIAAAAGCTIVSATLSAQATDTPPSASKSRWELNVPTGTLIPTGEHRDALKRGGLSAVQLSFVPRPAFAIGAMVGWARSRDVGLAGAPKLDVFTYDVGAEARAPRLSIGGAVGLLPFAGLGVGGRSYNHRSLALDATHNLAAYAGAGAELAYRRVRVRLEARDYVSGLRPLSRAGESTTGHDVVLMAGLRIAGR